VNYDRGQTAAIQRAEAFLADERAKVLIIMGPAGSGKTTIAKEIAKLCRRPVFGAYTGKAASVLQRKGCFGATTLHRLFYRMQPKSEARLVDLKKRLEDLKAAQTAQPATDRQSDIRRLEYAVAEETKLLRRPGFSLNLDPESEAAQADCVIVDEVSMVDERMGSDILKIAKKVIVTGDPYQLPPVGGGGYFTNRKPDITLSEIHRQGADSPILDLATDIRNGKGYRIGDYGPALRILSSSDPRKRDLCLGADQMIIGLNETRKLANAGHRESRGITDPHPVVGDRLVALKNDHEYGIYNGTVWHVVEVGDTMGQGNNRTIDLTVRSDDDPEVVLPVQAWLNIFEGADPPPGRDKDDPQCFYFGYAITCHKSQGSEWKNVYVYDQSRYFRNDWAKWLYTAVTRASESLTLVAP
jgi:exodeoxyribonuclease-5